MSKRKECVQLIRDHNLWDKDPVVFKQNIRGFLKTTHTDKTVGLSPRKRAVLEELAKSINNCMDLYDKNYNLFHSQIKSVMTKFSPPKPSKKKSPPPKPSKKKSLTKNECVNLRLTKVNPLTKRTLTDHSRIYKAFMKDCYDQYGRDWKSKSRSRSGSPPKKRVSCSRKRKADCVSPCKWTTGKGCRLY